VTPGGEAPTALEFRADGGAVRLRLRVAAGAARSRVAGAHGGALKVSVRPAPERGKANREVVALVAARFGVAARDVVIVAGETSPDKVVRLPLAPDEAARRWAAGTAG
jgi:hypothetical protein